jgi:choline dehydrogenase-like flavoprotein
MPELGGTRGEIGSYHHMCTTRMSADPATGVVDADCKVFGIDNLYIGGSSVFSTTSFVNPTYTIVQLALRLGDHVAGELHA